MPKTTKVTPQQRELPSPLRRSGSKAQETFAKAHDSAAGQYHDDERAHRVAYAALKRTHEKIGDHWEPKAENGPSDARAEEGRGSNARTAGGVDANASKQHLYDVAKRLDISGRSRMSKGELVEAIQRENDSRTRAARS